MAFTLQPAFLLRLFSLFSLIALPLLLFSSLTSAAPADGIVAWSASDKNNNVNLANNNLEATIPASAGSGFFGLRSNRAIAPGDGFFYFELEQLVGSSYALGIATANVPLTTSGELEAFLSSNPEAGVMSNVYAGVIGVAVDYRGGHPTVYFIGNDEFDQTPESVASISPEVDMTSVTAPVYIYVLSSSGGQYHLNFGGANGADFDWNPVEVLEARLYNIDSVLEYGWPVAQAKPVVNIVEGSQLTAQGSSITFTATATDSAATNISASVNWYLNNVLIGSGASISPSTATAGIHTLSATVSDDIGLSHSVSVGLYVHPTAGGGNLDQDMDGLTYAQEVAANTNPGKFDTDADGLSDGYEVANGTNPIVSNSPIAIEAHKENVFFNFEPGLTYNIVTTSDDGLSVGYLPIGGKAAIRANQGMKGEFRYWEGQAFFDADMGFGLINPDEKIDDYCCVTPNEDGDLPPGSSMSVNTFLNNSIWQNLVNVGGFTNNDEYLGFAVDYRTDDPVVYVIGSSGLQTTLTLSDYPSTDPIFPMVYGNAGEVEDRGATAIQRANFGQEPFFYDVDTILSTATDEGTPLNIDTTDLVPGWGKYRQQQLLNLDVLSQTVDVGSAVTLNASAKDASGADASASVIWTVFDEDENDVTDSVTSSTPPVMGASFTFTPPSVQTYTVQAQITDSKTGNAFARTSTVISNPLPETVDPEFTVVPEDITVRIVSGTFVSAAIEQLAAFLASAVATDNSGLEPTITNDAPENFPVGNTTVTFTAEDIFDNEAAVSAVVTVIVTGEVPVVSVPEGGTTVSLSSGATLPLADTQLSDYFASVSATDIEDGSLTASITHNAPSAFPVGVTQVTFSVTDSQGNTGQANAAITVVDEGNPVILEVNDITVNSTSGASVPVSHTDIANFLSSVTASDDVDGAVAVSNDAPSSFQADTITTITFTAVDDAQNAAEPKTAIVRIVSVDLVGGIDTDGDNIDDDVEGTGDDDGDRIPNYLDDSTESTEIPVAENAVMKSTTGTQLVLGEVAFAAASADASVSIMDILDYGDGGSSVVNGDDSDNYSSRIVDFEVRNVPVGASADVVIPQAIAIPAGAFYRKYTPAQSWVNFVEDDHNSVASALSTGGECPAANDSAYTGGLTEGDDCVRLRIQDGGPNDADGSANGVIKDPSSVAVEVNTTAQRSSTPPSTPFASGSGEQLVFSFEVTNNTGDAVINGFTFSAGGSMDDVNDISAVNLYLDVNRDGMPDDETAIATGQFTADDGVWDIDLATSLPLPIGITQFLVYYTF